MRISSWMAAGSALAALSIGWAPQAHSADFQREQRVGPMTVYVGVLPSELVALSLKEGEHGGVPRGRGWQHVLIALFDSKTGQRITDAEATARVEDVARIQSADKRLEPMMIAGTVTFGNYFSMPSRDPYSIHVRIDAHGYGKFETTFHYRHLY